MSIALNSTLSFLERLFLIVSYPLNFSSTQAERFLVTVFFSWTFFYEKSIHVASFKKFNEKSELRYHFIQFVSSFKETEKCFIYQSFGFNFHKIKIKIITQNFSCIIFFEPKIRVILFLIIEH